MKKKILIALLSLLAIFACAFAISACNNDGGGHTHNYGSLVAEQPATCAHTGVAAHYHCNVCNKYFDKDKVEVTEQQLTIPENKALHELDVDSDVCSVCGDRLTVGLEYTPLGDEAYSVSKGSATDRNIVIPAKYNGKPVTSIGNYAFYNCTKLTSITIGNGVTEIGNYAFWRCTSLKSITIPNNVTTIGEQAFYYCDSLTSVTIGSGVTSIGIGAFYGCTSLKGVYITDLAAWCKIEFGSSDANPLYYADKLYLNKNLVTNITADMLQGVTAIGSRAFSGCTSLTSIEIPDSVTSIGTGAFYGCASLKGVYITDVAAWCKINFGNAYANPLSYAYKLYLNKNLVTDITADMLQGVTSIGNYAFQGYTSLTSIEIPNSVTYIGDYAFSVCTSLESITIPDSVTEIGSQAFYNCTSLTNVTIGSGVTEIGDYAFYNCTKLTSITIGNGVTEIGNYAFSGCTSLESIEIPDSVTSIGSYAFYGCASLTSVTFANTTGWRVSGYSSMSNSQPAPDLSNPTQNAEYLTDTYHSYYWKRG